MDSTVIDGGGGGVSAIDRERSHVVELVASTEASDSVSEDQITPLLTQSDKPKLSIFTVSYPKRKNNKDQIARLIETESSPFTQFIIWIWGGSRYSGMLSMVLSSSIYCIMGILQDIGSAQAIPLFEIAFTRCVIISILSYMWLRRSADPIFGAANVRTLLVLRALSGCISLLTFIYSVQRIPMSQAMILSFTAPLMATVASRFILNENLKLVEVAGIGFSFFGVLFMLGSPISIQGASAAEDGGVDRVGRISAVLIGSVSSLAAGISYCLIRAAAKSSDQPLGTVFAFGLLSTPVVAICMITTEEFVVPTFYSFILMIVLSILAFFAQLFLARGLQLEKTSKVANILYLEVALFELWGMGSSGVVVSFGKLVGCLIVFVSSFCTIYFGLEKEME